MHKGDNPRRGNASTVLTPSKLFSAQAADPSDTEKGAASVEPAASHQETEADIALRQKHAKAEEYKAAGRK